MEEYDVLLITTNEPGVNPRKAYHKEMEIRSLLDTLGLKVAFHIPFTVKDENPNTYIGPGQAEEAARIASETGCSSVVINAFITAREELNLEKIFSLEVMDRENVILSIFLRNAHSKEALLQIEKAQAEYLRPRLRGRILNLEQQRGGVRGAKGLGERMIELDRRKLDRRINAIDKELEKIERVRETQKKDRTENSVFSFALVGYTNAGKSSIMNALTKADVLIEDKLFATLDTTTRKLRLKNGETVLLSDTVGFIEDLPHRLISAFSSTLNEALSASALIIVQDLESPNSYENFLTTLNTIKELGAEDKIKLLVLNKVDREYDDYNTIRLKNYGYEYVVTSVKENIGLEELVEKLERITDENETTIELKTPLDGSIFSKIRKGDTIISTTYKEDALYIKIRIKKSYIPYYGKLNLE